MQILRPNVSNYIDETNIALFETLYQGRAIECMWADNNQYSFFIQDDVIYILFPREDNSSNSFTNILIDIHEFITVPERPMPEQSNTMPRRQPQEGDLIKNDEEFFRIMAELAKEKKSPGPKNSGV